MSEERLRASSLSPSLRDSVSHAATQIESIIDSAEKVTAEIHQNAEREAEEYVERRRHEADELFAKRTAELEGLSRRAAAACDALDDQVKALTDSIEQTLSVITSAMRGAVPSQQEGVAPTEELVTANEGKATPEEDVPTPREHVLRPFSPPLSRGSDAGTRAIPTGHVPAGSGSQREGDSRLEKREEAILRATQMAVNQRSREEIQATISVEFDLEDPRAIAEEVLGLTRGG